MSDENVSAVTHPRNAAPGHPALTNVGTVYDSDADPDSPGVVTGRSFTPERKAELRRRLEAASQDDPPTTEEEVHRLGEVQEAIARGEDYEDFLTDSELDRRLRVYLDRACELAREVSA